MHCYSTVVGLRVTVYEFQLSLLTDRGLDASLLPIRLTAHFQVALEEMEETHVLQGKACSTEVVLITRKVPLIQLIHQ